MKREKVGVLLGLVTALLVMVLPGQAEALIRLGVDARWSPLGFESMVEEGEALVSQRQLESLGIGARVLFGFEQFSAGPKLNFSRNAYSPDSLSYSQFDINAAVRVGFPEVRLAVVAEAGPSISLNIGGVGYNGVLGVEFDLLGWRFLDLNLGLGVEYVSVPIGAGPSTVRMNEGLRAMVVVGVDLSLQPGGGSRE